MNTFKAFLLLLFGVCLMAILSGCGLTPKQLQALDGAMCTKIYGATTTIMAGASKGNMSVNGENCSITSGAK